MILADRKTMIEGKDIKLPICQGHLSEIKMNSENSEIATCIPQRDVAPIA
jgi:hypothetical protein